MSERPNLPTKQEAEAIRAGERETINRVYISNYDFIRACARGYLMKKVGRFGASDLDELANEAYLNFPQLDFGGEAELTISLYDTFCFFHFGGKRVFFRYRGFRQADISLDAPVKIHARSGEKNEGATLSDLLIAPEEEVEDNSRAVFLAVAKFLTAKEREIFFYQTFTGFTSEEIAQTLGKTRGAVLSQMCTLRKAIILHYHEILLRLWKGGCVGCVYYLKRDIVPPDLEKVQEFYERRRKRSRERVRKMAESSEEWHKKRIASLRKYREKKRQERQKAD